ncbi:cell wall hydrolase [Erythrobacter tepidarius]|uniref:cell wall hydrolase n=1 Tax=Erythrobacter tepidarius TaxID=60454 RepID=UPI000A3C2E23|nr:cell wall hydrolase [Erythrobacter tepidarius]
MSRKTLTFVALAVMTMASLTIPGVDGAAALAEVAENQLTAGRPAVELVPPTPAPISEPVVQPLPAAEAAPELTEADTLAELVSMVDTDAPVSDELRCLAGAVYFEARGEALAGQLAVAQVIINRTEDGRFPRSYCGVVAQPGQFSFMRGRRMPAIPTASSAWTRAVAIARIAHQGLWESEVGDAVFFHAKYVRPGWSRTKARLAQIDTHIFYR